METLFGVILSGSITLSLPGDLSCKFVAGPPPAGIADPLAPRLCSCEFRNAWRRWMTDHKGIGVETSDDFKVTEPGAIYMYYRDSLKPEALEQCSPVVG